MQHQLTYERGGRELPSTLILPGSTIEWARKEAARALRCNGADQALIRDGATNVIEIVER